MPPDKTDKIIGCILGGAVGDAVGVPYEASASAIETPELNGRRISDDTQLTLATCEAIVESNCLVEPHVVASRFASWHKQRRVQGMGSSTFKALSELVAGGHWALVGRRGEHAAGNGAAMRIAPLAFCLNPERAEDRRLIRDVCRITHHNEEAYVGALAVTIAIRAAWEGEWKGQPGLLTYVLEQIPESRVRDRLSALANMEGDAPIRVVADRFGCSGYVVESVPLALYGAQKIGTLGFVGLLRELISVRGDTDTIASIAGQVAGTVLGSRELPKHLVTQLEEVSLIEGLAFQFARKIGECSGN